MYELTDEQFDKLISSAMDELPQEYIVGLENVVIVQADDPTPEQIEKMKIDNQHILLGLYEGIPLTQRGSGFSGMLPDKITLFKNSILAEQAEPERIVLDERPEEGKLVGYLEAITADVQNDADEFTFSED